jgi:hypothetical protein
MHLTGLVQQQRQFHCHGHKHSKQVPICSPVALDCFVEPVLGRGSRTRGLEMTIYVKESPARNNTGHQFT